MIIAGVCLFWDIIERNFWPHIDEKVHLHASKLDGEGMWTEHVSNVDDNLVMYFVNLWNWQGYGGRRFWFIWWFGLQTLENDVRFSMYFANVDVSCSDFLFHPSAPLLCCCWDFSVKHIYFFAIDSLISHLQS